jgi:hypothetical protein
MKRPKMGKRTCYSQAKNLPFFSSDMAPMHEVMYSISTHSRSLALRKSCTNKRKITLFPSANSLTMYWYSYVM